MPGEVASLLEELQMARYLENNTGSLMDLQPSVIERVKARKELLTQKARQGEMPDQRELDGMDSIRYTLEEVFSARLHKLLLIIKDDVECQSSCDESVLLPFEKELYQSVYSQVDTYLKSAGVKS